MGTLTWIFGLVGLLAGGWRGLIVGAVIGWALGRLLPSLLAGTVMGKLAQVQTLFVDSTFAVMGAMCKADGRVSEDEIRMAENLFQRMSLSPQARAAAMAAFERGKSPDFDLDAEVARFAQASAGQRVLHQMFIQVQLSALAADGAVHPAEHAMLLRIARGLGFTPAEVANLEAMLRGGGAGSGAAGGPTAATRLEEAYRTLGVAPGASDAEVKRAYRTLMSQNHPDKLAAKGLPESMRQEAEEKTRAITAAYDLIEKSRKAG